MMIIEFYELYTILVHSILQDKKMVPEQLSIDIAPLTVVDRPSGH